MDELLNTIPGGFLQIGEDGRILQANATLLKLLGYEQSELIGQHIETILSVGGRIFYQTHFFPLFKLQGHAEEIYLTLASAAGQEIPVLLNALRRTQEQDAVIDWLLIPIFQRSRYEDEIIKARRAAEDAAHAKDAFLAMVTHELRSPLNAILGWADMLRGGEVEAAEILHGLDVIAKSARLQARLIEDLLDLARIRSGNLRIESTQLDLAQLVDTAAQAVRLAAESRNIHFEIRCDENVGPVYGDAIRMQQIIWNLLTNAIKFTPPNGQVRLSLSQQGQQALIEVNDTGQGISPAFLPYVFEPFRQAEADSNNRRNGLGLGLAIVSRLVEAHGGGVEAMSPGIGQGSTFKVWLPFKPST